MRVSTQSLCAALLVCATLQLAAASQCAVGDAKCFCQQVKGEWLATPTVIRPTCRKTVDVQGTLCIANVAAANSQIISSKPDSLAQGTCSS